MTRTSQRAPQRYFRPHMGARIFSRGKPYGVMFDNVKMPHQDGYCARAHPTLPREPPFGVTSHPVAMSVMRNGTYCTTTIVRKKRGNRLRTRSLPVMTASGHVTDVTSGQDRFRQLPRTLPPKYCFVRTNILLSYLWQ